MIIMRKTRRNFWNLFQSLIGKVILIFYSQGEYDEMVDEMFQSLIGKVILKKYIG